MLTACSPTKSSRLATIVALPTESAGNAQDRRQSLCRRVAANCRTNSGAITVATCNCGVHPSAIQLDALDTLAQPQSTTINVFNEQLENDRVGIQRRPNACERQLVWQRRLEQRSRLVDAVDISAQWFGVDRRGSGKYSHLDDIANQCARGTTQNAAENALGR